MADEKRDADDSSQGRRDTSREPDRSSNPKTDTKQDSEKPFGGNKPSGGSQGGQQGGSNR